MFAENPETFVQDYSREFEDSFMEIIKRKGEHVKIPFFSSPLTACSDVSGTETAEAVPSLQSSTAV